MKTQTTTLVVTYTTPEPGDISSPQILDVKKNDVTVPHEKNWLGETQWLAIEDDLGNWDIAVHLVQY